VPATLLAMAQATVLAIPSQREQQGLQVTGAQMARNQHC